MRILRLDSSKADYELQKIGVCPAGVRVMKKKYEVIPIKIFKVPVTEANIIKQEMLSIGGDSAQASGAINHSVNYTDIILLGTMAQYEKFIYKLTEQNFDFLKRLSSKLKDILNNKEDIFLIGNDEYTLEKKYIMGIINVTPDSFYRGSRKSQYEVIEESLKMQELGADFIDIGAESTRPGALKIDEREEIERLKKIIPELVSKIKIPISIDTYKSSVAEFCLDNGVKIVNDISGMEFDNKMVDIVKKYAATVVLMHIKGTPRNMQDDPYYIDVIKEVYDSLEKKRDNALEHGIDNKRLILDTGIGFGKRLEDNYVLIARHREFLSLGCPLLLGISRKSLIGKVLDNKPEERLNGTSVLNTLGLVKGATILRVHDVKEACECVKLYNEFEKGVEYGLY